MAQAETLTDVPVSGRGSASEVGRLAGPIVLATIAETGMQVIDTAMLGHLGATEMGGAGFSGLLIWNCFVLFTGTAQGVQSFVSRHDGANEPERCGPWIWQAAWPLVPAMALWMVALAFLFPRALTLAGLAPEMQGAATVFGLARLAGGPAIAMNFILFSFFRGISDTRTPLIVTLIGVSLHIPIAYGLIFGHFGLPAWGVMGAGTALAISSWVYLALLLFAALRAKVRKRYHTALVRPRRDEIARFLRTSAPIGGQWFLDMTTFAIFGWIVARMGATSAAASYAMLQLLSLSFMQCYAISLACGTLVGRYIGARDLDAAERSYRTSLSLGLLVTAGIAILFLSIPGPLLRIFNHEPDFLELGRPLLALGAFFQVVDGVGIIAGGALRGAGDTRWPFWVQSSLSWTLRLAAIWILAVWLQGGVFGAWVGEMIYVFALGLAWLFRFRAGHWRTVRI